VVPTAKSGDPTAKSGDPTAKSGDPTAKSGDPTAKSGGRKRVGREVMIHDPYTVRTPFLFLYVHT
jgi:hypothetical protein